MDMGVQGGWGRGWDPRAPRGAFRGALGRELGVPGAWWGCLVPCRGLQPHAAMGPGPWPPFPSCLRRERGLCAAAAPCRCGTSGSPGMKGLFRRGLRPRPASGNRSRGGRLQPGTQCPSVLGTWVPHPACPAGTSRPWAVSRARGGAPQARRPRLGQPPSLLPQVPGAGCVSPADTDISGSAPVAGAYDLGWAEPPPAPHWSTPLLPCCSYIHPRSSELGVRVGN